jgi:hypothetical protein
MSPDTEMMIIELSPQVGPVLEGIAFGITIPRA